MFSDVSLLLKKSRNDNHQLPQLNERTLTEKQLEKETKTNQSKLSCVTIVQGQLHQQKTGCEEIQTWHESRDFPPKIRE